MKNSLLSVQHVAYYKHFRCMRVIALNNITWLKSQTFTYVMSRNTSSSKCLRATKNPFEEGQSSYRRYYNYPARNRKGVGTFHFPTDFAYIVKHSLSVGYVLHD